MHADARGAGFAGIAGIAVQALLLVLYWLAQALIAPSVRALPKA